MKEELGGKLMEKEIKDMKNKGMDHGFKDLDQSVDEVLA